jgi:ribosome biogenesis protein MAK21
MGKHRKPSAKGSGPITGADSDMLPSFDEKALSALTGKIEKRFGENTASQQSVDTGSRNYKKGKPSNGRRDSDSKIETKYPDQNRGTKRDAHGNVKTGGKAKAESSTSVSKKQNRDIKDDRNALLKEILALGGTEEDLDLVAGVASDDEDLEETNGPAQDKSLKKELAKFVAGLGIEGAAVEDASESEVEQDEEAEGGWEETSDLDSASAGESDVSDEPEETLKKPTQTLPDTKAIDASSKGPNRLVSTPPL